MQNEFNVPYLDRMPAINLNDRVSYLTEYHSKKTPFWTSYQWKVRFKLDKIQTQEDLILKMPVFPSSILRTINPKDLISSDYRESALIESPSSGTTGPSKTCYWHEDEARLVDLFSKYVLELQNFPKNERWIGTETPNSFLKRYLRNLAIGMGGAFEGIDVTSDVVVAVKNAATNLDSNGRPDFAGMVHAYSPIIEKVRSALKAGATIYEDATVGLLLTGGALKREGLSDSVKGILFGAVATDVNNVSIVRQAFPNANVGGWYGNHFTGPVMYRPNTAVKSLRYQSMFPFVIVTVRKYDDINELADYGERGVVVGTKVTDKTLLSIELGDEATRVIPIEPLQWDGVSDVTRISKDKMGTLKERLYKF